jgi:ketosteroid isomerase-like protein
LLGGDREDHLMQEAMSKTVEQLRGSYDALNRRDIDGTVAVLDEHATWVEHSELPEAGSYQGRETIRAFLEQFLESWDQFEQRIEEVQEKDGCVLLFIRLNARGTGSGIEVESRYAHLWLMRAGRGVRVDAYYDRESALAALRAARAE